MRQPGLPTSFCPALTRMEPRSSGARGASPGNGFMAGSTPSPRAVLTATLATLLIAVSLAADAQTGGIEPEGANAAPYPAPAAGRSASLPPAAPAAKPGVNRGSVRELLFQANPMLWPLGACSVFTLGIALERLLAVRRQRVMPAEFVDRFLERLSTGKLDRERALELCKAHDSPAARIFGLVVKAWGQPGATIRQTVSYDAAGEVVELKRNLRVLSGLATIGPLLGLLGTVVGIIQSFDALGGRIGPRAARPWPRGSVWHWWRRRWPGDCDLRGCVLLLLAQPGGRAGARAGREDAPGHRAGVERGGPSRRSGPAPRPDLGLGPAPAGNAGLLRRPHAASPPAGREWPTSRLLAQPGERLIHG